MRKLTRTKTAIRFRKPGNTPLASSIPQGDRAVRVAMVAEFLHSACEAFTQAGVPLKDQLTAFKLASSGKTLKSRVAETALQRSVAVSELLAHWLHEKPYTDSLGLPKVLPISGKGATLQRLALKFVPDMRLEEVLIAITRHGEAVQLLGEKVALLGTDVLVPPKTPEMTLANVTTAGRRLLNSILHNARLPEKHKTGKGHLTRFVIGNLTTKQHAKWLKASRPDLQKAVVTVEKGLRAAGSKPGKGKTSGVAIVVFRDE
jgi:hypothetical protein